MKAAVTLLALMSTAFFAGADVLWSAGQADNDTADLALGPDGYHGFQDDAYFIVGRSSAEKDWPYVQPGPMDAWAGSRPHTYTVAFSLGEAPEEGNCRLRIDLVDAHKTSPPLLHIHVNETLFQHAVSKGQGDASINGDPAKGAEQIVDVEFPASLLKVGHNEISITTHSGSWILYDAIQLDTPPVAKLAPGAARTVMASFETPAVLLGEEDSLTQPIHISIRRFGEPVEGTIEVSGLPAMPVSIKTGAQVIQYAVPAVEEQRHPDGVNPCGWPGTGPSRRDGPPGPPVDRVSASPHAFGYRLHASPV